MYSRTKTYIFQKVIQPQLHIFQIQIQFVQLIKTYSRFKIFVVCGGKIISLSSIFLLSYQSLPPIFSSLLSFPFSYLSLSPIFPSLLTFFLSYLSLSTIFPFLLPFPLSYLSLSPIFHSLLSFPLSSIFLSAKVIYSLVS